jgi:hypothetical protein
MVEAASGRQRPALERQEIMVGYESIRWTTRPRSGAVLRRRKAERSHAGRFSKGLENLPEL